MATALERRESHRAAKLGLELGRARGALLGAGGLIHVSLYVVIGIASACGLVAAAICVHLDWWTGAVAFVVGSGILWVCKPVWDIVSCCIAPHPEDERYKENMARVYQLGSELGRKKQKLDKLRTRQAGQVVGSACDLLRNMVWDDLQLKARFWGVVKKLTAAARDPKRRNVQPELQALEEAIRLELALLRYPRFVRPKTA